MTARRIVLAALAALCLAQIALPARQILRWEAVLSNGERFRFRTAPFDPADALRGRYVALALEAANTAVPAGDSEPLEPGDRAFASLSVGPDGFARLAAVSRSAPTGPYVAVRIVRREGGAYGVALPFDRYYLPEDLAPDVEAAYRELSRRDRVDAFVTVRVLHGDAALEDLVLGGVPVRRRSGESRSR